MELLEIHRGHIKVGAFGRTVTIEGEGFLRSNDQTALSPNHIDYVLYASTLTHWDKPWENEPLPPDVRSALLDFIGAYFEQRGQLLAVE